MKYFQVVLEHVLTFQCSKLKCAAWSICLLLYTSVVDPDPNPDPSSNVPTSKKSLKNLDFYYFVTSFGLFSWKYDVNVTLKSYKQENFEILFYL